MLWVHCSLKWFLFVHPFSSKSHYLHHCLKSKEIGSRYKKISAEEKAKWQTKADAAKEAYKKVFAEYEKNKPKEEKPSKKAEGKKKKKKQPEPKPESSESEESADDSDDSDSDSDSDSD